MGSFTAHDILNLFFSPASGRGVGGGVPRHFILMKALLPSSQDPQQGQQDA
jgi:hypothetical protein